MLMLIQKLSAAGAVLSLFGLAGPAGSALAAPMPAASVPPTALPLLTFVPPKVGPLSVNIGPTIIGGKTISAGVSVSTPGISLQPIAWTPPAGISMPTN
jgi:hypothetical protein